MGQAQRAKVFRNGRSQAVRIPAEFRFKSDEVFVVRNEETGALTLSEQPPRTSMADLFARIDADGGFEFELDRDTRVAEERKVW